MVGVSVLHNLSEKIVQPVETSRRKGWNARSRGAPGSRGNAKKRFCEGEAGEPSPYTNSYSFSFNLAWAAASRAMGTLGGEQET